MGLSWLEAAKVLGAGLFLIVGYLTSVMAMRCGDIGLVAPFRYTSLLWAIALGLLVFGDLPDGWTIIGSAIVVGAGLFTLLRERALRRAPRGLLLTPPAIPPIRAATQAAGQNRGRGQSA